MINFSRLYSNNKPETDPILNRKKRFIISFILVAMFLSFIMGTFNLISKPFNWNTFFLLSNVILGLCIIIYIKKTENIFLPSQIICAAIYFASVSGGYHTGGIYSLDLQPLLHVPLTAFILHNRKSAFVWLIISLITLLGFYIAEFQYNANLKANLEDMSHFTYYVKRGMFVIYIAAILIFYEISANNMTIKIFNKKNEVDKLKSEIESQYKLVLDNMNESVFLIDSKFNILYSNKISNQIFNNKLNNKNLTSYFKEDVLLEISLNNTQIIEFEDSILELKSQSIENNEYKKLTILIINNVTEKLKAKEQVDRIREQIARDFHDEMGNKLAGISIRSNLIINQKNTKLPENLQNNLIQINNSSINVYQTFRDFIWSINHQSDSLSETYTYLKDFIEDNCQNLNINFTTQSTGNLEIDLPIYWNRQIIYIFKEAFTNAIKHSQCSEITLGLTLKDDKLHIWLKDNGVGFLIEKCVHQRGITHFEKRAKTIHCNTELTSTLNVGTTLHFYGNITPPLFG